MLCHQPLWQPLPSSDTAPFHQLAHPPDSNADPNANNDRSSRGTLPQRDWQVLEYNGNTTTPPLAQRGPGRELHTTEPAVCILEQHPTTANLQSYLRTRWVQISQQHTPPGVSRTYRDLLGLKSRDTQEGAVRHLLDDALVWSRGIGV